MNTFRIKMALDYALELLPYLRITLVYVCCSLFIGLFIGFFFAAAKLGKNKVLRFLAYTYTAILRSIPSVVLIFLVYYGVPAVVKSLFGKDISRVDKVIYIIITLSLYSIASLSEIMRSSYQSINKGQYEAAVSTGLSEVQTFVRIMFPQAFFVSLPNLGNSIISLLKEGALGFTIGLVDIMGQATLLNSLTYGNNLLEIYVSLAIIYWIISSVLEKLCKVLEHKFSNNRQRKLIVNEG